MLLVYCLMYSGKIQTLLSRPSVVSCGQYPRVSEKRIRPLPRMKDKYDGWVLLAQIVSFIMQLFEASRFPNTREENCLARSLGARDTMWETHCPFCSLTEQILSFHGCWQDPVGWGCADSRQCVYIILSHRSPEKWVYEALASAQMGINIQTASEPSCGCVNGAGCSWIAAFLVYKDWK